MNVIVVHPAALDVQHVHQERQAIGLFNHGACPAIVFQARAPGPHISKPHAAVDEHTKQFSRRFIHKIFFIDGDGIVARA